MPVPDDVHVGPTEVVFTPGHAPGHISLHFPEAGFLASGDALHAPEGELDGPRFPIDEAEAVESVRKLAQLGFDATLTQHGGLVDAGADKLDAVLAERDE